ncbi:hypothetical protein ACFC08_00095 [Streptomyces sp. NPDC056112]|uniref:hypothetical protein n=1 Tax=Streptomyces sp. NPDC056112 TaxID=3345715 RepID=UPI0035E24488
MDRHHILELYHWTSGTCFRHPAKGEVPTAHVKTIRPAAGGIQDIRACTDCVVGMEAHRQAAAEGAGLPYRPGAGAGE